MANRRLNIAGHTFGRLTALSPVGVQRKAIVWNCICVCGKPHDATARALKSGRVKSCGCLLKEHAARIGKESHHMVHGHAKNRSREYSCYLNARRRCMTPSHPAWPNYGGRGIKFLFASFLDFYRELGDRPLGDYSVDRIDNDGDYEAGNVRWATRTEQNNNQRPRKAA